MSFPHYRGVITKVGLWIPSRHRGVIERIVDFLVEITLILIP